MNISHDDHLAYALMKQRQTARLNRIFNHRDAMNTEIRKGIRSLLCVHRVSVVKITHPLP